MSKRNFYFEEEGVANNWAWCWAHANFKLGGGLSSTSKEYKGFRKSVGLKVD
jgi:hypothetical protein